MTETPTPVDPIELDRELVERFGANVQRIHDELGKVIVGQRRVIDEVLVSLFAGGHCLLTGAPGLAKTLLVRSVASIFRLDFQRIQFTPDLMPADILGTEVLQESAQGRALEFLPGPIFAHVVLADEINRTPPKTQAALLEAMQEQQVTIGGKRFPLEAPFFVLATQNPIELEGTYPLPEAQLDRFLFNVVLDYLPEDEEVEVVERTTGSPPQEIEPLFDGADVKRIHAIVRKVPVAQDLVRYAVRLAAASRPGRARSSGENGTPAPLDFVDQWVSWGAGTRAGQHLILGSKARALLLGRSHVTVEDVRALVHPTLRHRILVGYRAEAEGVTVDQVIDRLLESVPTP